MNVITAEHLKYRYPGSGEMVLKDISFTVKKGEFIGIIGKNGAGKSTLSQSLIGLVPQFYKGAYGGNVNVCGMDASKTPTAELCGKAGLIFQNPFNQLSGARDTVFEEVAFGMQNLGIPRDEMLKRTEEVLKKLDIWQFRDRNPFDLSGGQTQRTAISSILVMQPEIVILDEPTSQLDPQGTEEVFRAVDEMRSQGITIIMIEQKMDKISKYCDRVMLLNEGRLVDFDIPEKIFSRDDLFDMGITPPGVTLFSKENGLKINDHYPCKEEELINILKKKGGKACLSEDSCCRKELPLNEAKLQESFKVQNLSFSYTEGTPVIEDLNVTFDWRSTAIIGQNGAGKTTLSRLLKGLVKPQKGEIFFENEDISKRSVAALSGIVGYVFQNPDDQIFKYKVLDEVMFGPLNIGMSVCDARERAVKAIELVGLKGCEDKNPYDLELYERKMVAIASVISMDTRVIILDEPTIAQDYRGKELLGRLIRTLSEEGKLVISILHDMDFVLENFERVIVMAKGKILLDGKAEDVFKKDDILKEARLEKPGIVSLLERIDHECQ